MQTCWLRSVAVLLVTLLPLRAAAAEDKPSKAPQPTSSVTLEVTYPADLRDGVLRIAQNEGVVALDPASNKSVEPSPLPPVEQPMSVLRPVGAALAHLRGKPLDLDVLGALGDVRVLCVNRIGQMCWLILRPRGEPSEAERQSTMERLAAALTADKAFAHAATRVRVALMGPVDGAKDHEKRIRVRFDMPSIPAAVTARPPASVPAERIIEQMRSAERLSGYVERKIRMERDAKARHRTEIRTALVMCESRDPWHLWSFLAETEAKERVTVIEVRYERDGFHLSRSASAEDHGVARIKFAVRHPWISSNGLRADMDRIIAARGVKAAPLRRLILKVPSDRVESLVRLLSAEGVTVRQGGQPLRPTSPKTVSLSPSAAALFGALSELFSKAGIDLEGADGWSSHLTISLRYNLSLDGVDGQDEKAIAMQAEERLQDAWKGVVEHPFLMHRVDSAQVQGTEPSRGADAKSVHILAPVDLDLVEAKETARSGPTAPPLGREPLADVFVLAKEEGLTLRESSIRKREVRFRDGLMVLRASLSLEKEGLDRSRVLRILAALERLDGLSIDEFDWSGRGVLNMSLTRHHRIWEVARPEESDK